MLHTIFNMVSQRQKSVDFIEDIRRKTGLSYSGLATKAKVSPSTINRFIRDEGISELSIGTRDKMARVAGYLSYEDYILNNNPILNITLLQECATAIEQEVIIQKRVISASELVRISYELYKKVVDDRNKGHIGISPSLVKIVIDY